MATTCVAEKPPDTFATSAFRAALAYGQKEPRAKLVSWRAIHDHPESYWKQVLVESVSADLAACSRLTQEQELTPAS